MNRATWLQDRRMKKFLDVLNRFERRALSTVEAGELLGCSERQFLRHRRRYEEEGADEIVFLDVSASHEGRATLLEVARRTAEVLFVPLTLVWIVVIGTWMVTPWNIFK